MASYTVDVTEDILSAPFRPAQITMAPDHPYRIAMCSATSSPTAGTSAPPAASTSQGPSSSLRLPGTSRQLTLHQALARVAPRFAHRAMSRMSVRPSSPPMHFDAHALLSDAPPASFRRCPRSPTPSPHGSPIRRRRLMVYSSDEEEEEYEGEEEADDPQEAEQGDDDPQEGEEEEMPDDDGLPAHPAHAEERDSPIHPLEPVSPDHPLLFDSPPGSPVASDAPSEIPAKPAELGETGRIWTRITAQGERILQMADRLEMVIGEFIAELRVDLTTVVGRMTVIRRSMMEIHEQIESLQRGFIMAREADRKLWKRNTELEKEVADIKRDSDTHSVELGSLWRELDGLRQELRSLRQHSG
jgi:hypothetical protein